jgi:hypothetical protein
MMIPPPDASVPPGGGGGGAMGGILVGVLASGVARTAGGALQLNPAPTTKAKSPATDANLPSDELGEVIFSSLLAFFVSRRTGVVRPLDRGRRADLGITKDANGASFRSQTGC